MMRYARVIVALASLGAVIAVRAEQRPGPVRLSVELPDNPTAGARLFVEKQCVRCHALGGDEQRVGPDLGRIHITGTVLDVAGAFWNHAPVMLEKMRDLKIQAPVLSASEMADLLAFLTAYRYYLTELGVAGSTERGLEVFRAKSCDRCHGARNDWDRPGPSLERYQGQLSAIQMAEIMWNHGREMAPVMRARGVTWPKFKGREMGDLLAYLQAGNKGVGNERVYFEPGSPRRGQELFQGKHCNACHAIAGRGGRRGPDLASRSRDLVGSISSVAGLMWNHSPVMAAEAIRMGIPRVTFSGQEMADIIAYLYFVNYATVTGSPDRGAGIFNTRCSTCHSIGEGPRIGPDLGASAGLDEPLTIITTMWNHALKMTQEVRRTGQPWPRFAQGEAADLTAFLLSRRGRGAPPPRKGGD
jgi:cytochrome c2